VGDRFCVRTDKSRIVYFKVLSQTSTGWELNVTVWKQRTAAD
jgi:hypothetical protein